MTESILQRLERLDRKRREVGLASCNRCGDTGSYTTGSNPDTWEQTQCDQCPPDSVMELEESVYYALPTLLKICRAASDLIPDLEMFIDNPDIAQFTNQIDECKHALKDLEALGDERGQYV